MLCEKCNKNEAKFHLIMLINGEKRELSLCEECASKFPNVKFGMELRNVNESDFKNILDYFKNSNQVKNFDIDVICKNCGQTFSEYKKEKKVHCEHCYESFKGLLDEEILEYHKATEHVGKIPKHQNQQISKKNELSKLKYDLSEAIINEEYEKAASLRDMIKKLNDSEEEGHEFEKLES